MSRTHLAGGNNTPTCNLSLRALELGHHVVNYFTGLKVEYAQCTDQWI